MRRPALLAVCSLTLGLTAFALLGEALKQGEDALIRRRYADAAAHLERALTEEPAAHHDRVLLLLGRARWLAGQHQQAVAAYQRVLKERPDSTFAAKAAFQQAETLAAMRDYRGAALLYRDEVEKLIGLDRKEAVAATYLGLAEKAILKDPPDEARAVTFFDLALDLGLPADRARAVRLQAAEAMLRAGNAAGAIQRLVPMQKELEAEPDRGPRRRAMLALGRAKAKTGDLAGARMTLRDLIQLEPQSAEAGDAAWEIALTHGVPAPAPAELDRAVAALRTLAREHPKHPQTPLASYLIARCYQHAGRGDDALRALAEFLDAADRADLAEVPAARAMVGDVLLAQGKLDEALAAYRAYLKAHPAHGEWERVQRAIVDAEYRAAFLAFQAGLAKERAEAPAKRAEARARFDEFLRSYPLDERDPEILAMQGDLLFVEEQWEPAREAYARAVSKYPGKEASSRAQYQIGVIFETRTFDYVAALKAYRAVTWGSFAARAQQRIGLLERKHLALFTPRTYRTGERARFKLTSRNIESARVRVYRLDLETYFRSTHTAGDVHRLDIEVIAPSQVFENKIIDYRQYRETEREVEVPTDAPGAYVVKVDDGTLEATTMVLVTDVALIAKSSRHECFVLTQNLKDNRVEGGVKVVLSDGKAVLAEGTTGADGVWRWRGKELQNLEQVLVFAIAASGSGASSVGLGGLGFSPGLTPKGYLFTDRPAYQPGQVVHVKGIVREVKDGLYQLPAAAGYRVQALSASGRLLLQRDVRFTPFGTFTLDLALPPETELGEYRVVVTRGAETLRSDSFVVARYERPRLALAARLDANVVYRGEAIKGRFELRHFYGEPAAGKSIRYSLQLPGGALLEREGTTTAAGELAFELPTQDFAEEAMAVIQAEVVAEQARTAVAVPVVTTELAPSVSLVRPVVLVKEPFDARLVLEDRSGKGVARAGNVRLLRVETRNGGRSEVELAVREFQTDAAGRAHVPFTADRGGEHVVRIEAKDRFGTLVTAATTLFVSGDDDQVKLRLLGDRQSFKVGEQAAIKVVNRCGPRLALRTIQGDGILAYETAQLPGGESTIQLGLEALHAPNCALALTLIDGDQLHVAQRELEVARDLDLKITAPKDARPGATVDVAFEARDAQGRPLAAEIALSLVDRALLAVHPDATPKMGAFFFGERRATEFRTVSSCGWSYRAAGRAIDEALLAEERRRLEAEAARPEPSVPEIAEMVVMLGDADRVTDTRLRAGFVAGNTAAVADPNPPQLRFLQSQAGGGGDKDASKTRPAGKPAGTDWKEQAPQYRGIDLVRRFDRDESERGGFDLFSASTLALDQPRTDFSESGGWLSTIVTGADGKATAKVTIPDSTTSWRLAAHGVTQATDVGEAETDLRAKKELQADVAAPLALAEGDQVRGSLRLHNLSGAERAVAFTLSRKGDGAKLAAGERGLAAAAELEVPFDLEATRAEDVELLLAATSGPLRDELLRKIAVRPYGVELRDGRAGRLSEDATFDLSLPEGREYVRLALQLEIGPEGGRELQRAALGLGYVPANYRSLETTNQALASRGIAALRVLEYLRKSTGLNPADAGQLEAIAHAALAMLRATQNDDGGFAWVGKGERDLKTTATALTFLALARQQGLTCEAMLTKAADHLLGALTRGGPEERARAVLALALAHRARFEDLNALHRARASLSLGAAARLALAWQSEGRDGLAAETLVVLRPKLQNLPAKADAAQVEAFALATVAVIAANPADADATRLLEWLKARRTGGTWGTADANAAVLHALVAAGGSERAAAANADVDVTINGKALPATLEDGVFVASAPAEWLQPQHNRIALRLRGRGVAHYVVTLSGFAHGFRKEDRNQDVAESRRTLMPAPMRYLGKVIEPGFGVVRGSYKHFRNELTALAAGASGRVELSFWVKEPHREAMTPLVVEEPIPAGCSVPRDSIQGQFDHVVVEPDRLTFYYREGQTSGTIRYELHARFAGKYRIAPTRVSATARPSLTAHGNEAELRVLAAGEPSPDAFRMTPDELHALGRAEFEAGQLAAAGRHLNELLENWQKKEHQLEESVFKDVARMLLFVAIEQKDAKSIVRFFEELKDRSPDLVIPFEKILAVGKAYLDLGEFERALMVFRATAETSFLKDAAVATTLEGLGETKASVAFLRKLMLGYPDLNTIRLSLYGIGQKLAALAASIPDGAAVDEKIGRREELRDAALAALREFRILYPDDPLADEVAFAWATTLLEAKENAAALAVARAALESSPASPFTDELLYTMGWVQFALGKHEEAFAALKRVAEEEFEKPGGGKGPSENRRHAIYLQGQIHHALGRAEEALAAYAQVKDAFGDAVEATDYFLRKALGLPEVTTCALTDAARVKLSFRNVKRAEVKVYRVDLMRLYVLKKSLNDIQGIQLHGITPLAELAVELGDGRDYRTKEKEVALELKEPGAYLVVARGENQLASGMLLRSDLRIEAQEQPDVGRLRANVKRGDAFLGGAHVKVVGAGDARLQGGDSDLRGVFVASDLVGQATVLAKVGEEYAFYRGSAVHQPQRLQPKTGAPAQQDLEKAKGGREFRAMEQNYLQNDNNRARQVEWLKNEVLNKAQGQKGVEVYRTK